MERPQTETGGDAGIESANIYSLQYGCSIADKKEKINILMRPSDVANTTKTKPQRSYAAVCVVKI